MLRNTLPNEPAHTYIYLDEPSQIQDDSIPRYPAYIPRVPEALHPPSSVEP